MELGRYIINLERRIITLQAERKPLTLDDIPQRLGYNQRREVEDVIAAMLYARQQNQVEGELIETALDMMRNVRAGRADVKTSDSGHGWKVTKKG